MEGDSLTQPDYRRPGDVQGGPVPGHHQGHSIGGQDRMCSGKSGRDVVFSGGVEGIVGQESSFIVRGGVYLGRAPHEYGYLFPGHWAAPQVCQDALYCEPLSHLNLAGRRCRQPGWQKGNYIHTRRIAPQQVHSLKHHLHRVGSRVGEGMREGKLSRRPGGLGRQGVSVYGHRQLQVGDAGPRVVI